MAFRATFGTRSRACSLRRAPSGFYPVPIKQTIQPKLRKSKTSFGAAANLTGHCRHRTGCTPMARIAKSSRDRKHFRSRFLAAAGLAPRYVNTSSDTAGTSAAPGKRNFFFLPLPEWTTLVHSDRRVQPFTPAQTLSHISPRCSHRAMTVAAPGASTGAKSTHR